MASHFSLDVINIKINSYGFPKFAEKTNKHVCPVCNEQVILCKGKNISHYFAHYCNSDFCFYEKHHVNESQLHNNEKND